MQSAAKETMIYICAWCQARLELAPPAVVTASGVSHGICKQCREAVLPSQK